MTQLKEIISKLPTKPGVYRFLDKSNEVIYVGKAKNLKHRVSSYFRKQKNISPKSKVLISKIKDIKFTIVNSDLEAIILETNLIKELKPKYNILMKDDKNFTYIKITTQDKFPKIYLTRQIKRDKATYFGPKTSGFDIKNTVKLLSSFLTHPKCQINIQWAKNNKITAHQSKKPLCAFKEIDPDHTPCISDLPEKEYNEVINDIMDFFKGKHKHLYKNLENKMLAFAETKDFEKAAILRDRLESFQKITENQNISGTNTDNMDVLDIVFADDKYYANLFQIRESKLISQNNFILPSPSFTHEIDKASQEVFSNFILQYYSDSPDIPKEILLPVPLEDKNSLEEWLTSLKESNVKLHIPQIGRKHNLIKLATKNAEQYARLMKIKWMSHKAHSAEKVLPKLKKLLNLSKIPKRIECYDISHLSGHNTVGSMIVFNQGQPSKSDYRYFNLKSLSKNEINDFASLQEVLTRRLKYISKTPFSYRIQKQKTAYNLQEKSTKKEVFKIKYKSTPTEIHLDLLPKQTTLYQSNIYLFQNIIQHIIRNNKKQKILIQLKNKILKDTLLQLGFIYIDHSNFNLGFYPTKQITDKSFSKTPNLIIIDGGKGQLSAALKAKELYQLDIPFVAIAEKEDIIYTESNTEIILDKTSPVLHLIQQIRNEAHRFAIQKNRKDRIKEMLNS